MQKKLNFFMKPERKQNRIFENSFFGRIPQLREQPRIAIDLSTPCGIERTVYDLVSETGLDMQVCGAKYLIYTIIHTVNSQAVPEKIWDFYKVAAEKFDQKQKAIEVAISRAVDTIKMNRLKELNHIFGCTVFHNDMAISAGHFLKNLCARLVMLKCHSQNKTMFV